VELGLEVVEHGHGLQARLRHQEHGIVHGYEVIACQQCGSPLSADVCVQDGLGLFLVTFGWGG
jgi:hypothetical protein